ncbi:uncharacterized protein TRAVEDRAFT_73015 [Trametes versicolor FP-101664 SS1]|uniref:uncharacterized protein n=1 Tax=Trametes versicolor (strain FP-101664) TaxID=717944 RepID=UPI0004623B8A|nr:uncharacterized protein TRAVEDRAFT_73015 [Trametes versicolor FP-101664 SS1]EIW56425.1 hypothetical protein TRAVEDRAFT_73015 [Trametes versicolor FP-101664 SS1]
MGAGDLGYGGPENIFVAFYVTSDEDRPPLDGGQRCFWRRLRYAPGPPKSSDDVWRGPPRGAIGGRHRPGPTSTSCATPSSASSSRKRHFVDRVRRRCRAPPPTKPSVCLKSVCLKSACFKSMSLKPVCLKTPGDSAGLFVAPGTSTCCFKTRGSQLRSTVSSRGLVECTNERVVVVAETSLRRSRSPPLQGPTLV